MLVPAPPAEVLFRFQDPRIDESSGLVVAPGGSAYVTVDDTNPELRYFLVDGQGRTLSVTTFPGVDVRDLEDAAPGPDGTLYLGDIGDNRSVRPRVLVHVVPQPRVDLAARDAQVRGRAPTTYSLTYEDAPHDAETLLVHPRTGQVVVVTKGLLGSSAYTAPRPLADGVLRRAGEVRVQRTGSPGGPVGEVSQVLVTGGAVSPDGRRVVLRTYTDAYVYEVPGDDLAAALQTEPTVFPLPATEQGEAVAWTPDGTALVTSSEGVWSPVHRVTVPAPPAAPQETGPAAGGPGPAAAEPDPGALPVPPRTVVAVGGGLVLLALLAGLVLRRRPR